MPLFLIETRKATQSFGGRKWVNRYFVDVADAGEALDAAEGIWTGVERVFHGDDTYCYEVYANLQGDTPFTVGEQRAIPTVDQEGQLAILSRGELLPSFNVVRCDFSVPGSRPSRKFYRIPLRENDTIGDQLASASALVTALNAGLAEVPIYAIVDVDGQAWAGTYQIVGVTSRRFGKEAALGVPSPPAS